MRFAFLISALLLISGPVCAQQPLASGLQDLDFGAVLGDGSTYSVTRTEAGAAQFKITGNAGAEVSVTFTLPSTLSNGAGTMPISFSTTDAGYATTDNQAGAAVHDPDTELIANLNGTSGELFIWLGGTINSSGSPPGNGYTGDITITATYTN